MCGKRDGATWSFWQKTCPSKHNRASDYFDAGENPCVIPDVWSEEDALLAKNALD